jgi:hypothetical protein
MQLVAPISALTFVKLPLTRKRGRHMYLKVLNDRHGG